MIRIVNFYKENKKGVDLEIKKFSKIVKCKNQLDELIKKYNNTAVNNMNLLSKRMKDKNINDTDLTHLLKIIKWNLKKVNALIIMKSVYDQVHD